MSANPFWEFSLAFYERPGVAATCLRLQDEAGLDVNIVLFSLWCALEGPGALEDTDLLSAMAATEPWQAEVVRPLRAARRAAASTGGRGIFSAAFQRDVAATELSAERVEQWLLYERVTGRDRPAGGAAPVAELARQNLLSYLRLAGVDAAAWQQDCLLLLGECG